MTTDLTLKWAASGKEHRNQPVSAIKRPTEISHPILTRQAALACLLRCPLTSQLFATAAVQSRSDRQPRLTRVASERRFNRGDSTAWCPPACS
jgi:hypothetical protein